MKKLIIFLGLIFIVSQVLSQGSKKEQRGDEYFESHSLEEAIEEYEQIDVKGLSTSSVRNLSKAHQKRDQTIKAEKCYFELVNRKDNKKII